MVGYKNTNILVLVSSHRPEL